MAFFSMLWIISYLISSILDFISLIVNSICFWCSSLAGALLDFLSSLIYLFSQASKMSSTVSEIIFHVWEALHFDVIIHWTHFGSNLSEQPNLYLKIPLVRQISYCFRSPWVGQLGRFIIDYIFVVLYTFIYEDVLLSY